MCFCVQPCINHKKENLSMWKGLRRSECGKKMNAYGCTGIEKRQTFLYQRYGFYHTKNSNCPYFQRFLKLGSWDLPRVREPRIGAPDGYSQLCPAYTSCEYLIPTLWEVRKWGPRTTFSSTRTHAEHLRWGPRSTFSKMLCPAYAGHLKVGPRMGIVRLWSLLRVRGAKPSCTHAYAS